MSLDIVKSFQSQVKKLFKPEEILVDNFLFKLHRTYNFVLILIGIVFISSNNYLNKEAVVCVDLNKYVNSYCFLHGAAHIPSNLQKMLSPKGIRCIAEDYQDEKYKNSRTTNYYIWLPFVLTLCAVIIKVPNIIWKNMFERGMMKKLVKDTTTEKEEDMMKNAKRFYCISMRKTWQAPFYNLGFASCEILDILAIVINRIILDRLFEGKFSEYGTKATEYFAFKYDPINAPEYHAPNPLCNLFPTEVSCSVSLGGIHGGADTTNTLCLLSNNVFNQYFFLIVWWWWVFLLAISCTTFIYRLIQLGFRTIGKYRLTFTMNMLAVSKINQENLHRLNLGPSEIFLFNRLAINLKGSQVNRLIEKIIEIENSNSNTLPVKNEERIGISEYPNVALEMESG